jgi:transcriptional regulator with XRE-family HTH domain
MTVVNFGQVVVWRHKLHRIIGLQIKAARTEQSMTSDTLAQLLGVPPSQLGAMERGDLRVGAVQLYEVAQHCHKPLSFFFTMTTFVVHSR